MTPEKPHGPPKTPAAPSASPEGYGGDKVLLAAGLLFFLFCLFFNFTASLVEWNHDLNDFHGFRQCQTAISAYYTVKDGFSIHYETPVLGKPWSIPMEFPLYQWVVAGLVMAFHTPLDQTGRFVTLLFFYLTLLPVYGLLKLYLRDPGDRLILLGFILVNPTYLFWSRSFMIESLALFLCAFFLWATAKGFRERSGKYFALAAVAGSLAGLVKVTTLVGFWFPCGLLFLWRYFQENRSWTAFQAAVVRKYALYSLAVFAVPFAVSLAWVKTADAVKRLNPLAADFLTSQAENKWNFGTLDQKLSPMAWRQIFSMDHILNIFGQLKLGQGSVPVFLIVSLALVAILRRRRKERILAFAFFLFPMAVFTNLYFIHDYYHYANGVFLSLFLGFTVVSMLDSVPGRLKLFPLAVLAFFFLALLRSEYKASYDFWTHRVTPTAQISQLIRDTTKENDVLLIYGYDWDSTIPYYSQRRSLMDKWDMSLKDPKMVRALEVLGGDKIKAMLILGDRPADFIKEKVDYFRLDPKPLDLSGFHLYLSEEASKELRGLPAT